jgi:hypothetical protein
VLHARVADYEPAWCDLLYRRREIFEAYNKGFPSSRRTSSRGFADGEQGQPRRTSCRERRRGRARARAIRVHGPHVGARLRARARHTTDWFGMPTNAVKAVLEAYTFTASRASHGETAIALLRPARAACTAKGARTRRSARGAARHKDALPLPRARALGASSGGDVFFGLGPAKPDEARPECPGERHCARTDRAGELVPVEVEGIEATGSF